MKHVFSFLMLAGSLITLLIFTSNKTGVATNQSKDRTGSPVGEPQQCGQCHNGNNFNTSINLRVKDVGGNIVTEYVPFVQYTYEVEMTSTAPGYGFQTVALIASNNNTAGNLIAVSSNTKIVNLGGRKYGEQVTRSTTGLFEMEWDAPPPGSGDVKFYAAGIACNANNTTSGDQSITSLPLTLTEMSTGVNELTDSEFSIYPNPAAEQVTINIPGKTFGIIISDGAGKIVYAESNISSQTVIPVSQFAKGWYVVQVSGEVNAAKLFIKN